MDKTKTQLYKVGKKNILEILNNYYAENRKLYGVGIKVDVSELTKWVVDNKTYYYLCSVKRSAQKENRNLIYIYEDTEDNTIDISFVQKNLPRPLLNNRVINHLKNEINVILNNSKENEISK